MERLPSDQLESVRQALAGLRVTACRIAHEQVVIRDGAAMRRTVGSDQILVRIGLCSWDARQGQLSCAHTTARHQLQRIVTSLEELQLLPEEVALHTRARISELADSIHAADWARGALDAALALATEAGDQESRSAHEQKIAALEREHTSASGALAELLAGLRRLASNAGHAGARDAAFADR
jgi:hypothetical protein